MLTIVSRGSCDVAIEITSFAGIMTIFYIAATQANVLIKPLEKADLYEDLIVNLVIQLLLQ